jgi:hypothetical protein
MIWSPFAASGLSGSHAMEPLSWPNETGIASISAEGHRAAAFKSLNDLFDVGYQADGGRWLAGDAEVSPTCYCEIPPFDDGKPSP